MTTERLKLTDGTYTFEEIEKEKRFRFYRNDGKVLGRTLFPLSGKVIQKLNNLFMEYRRQNPSFHFSCTKGSKFQLTNSDNNEYIEMEIL